jgi:hypothetical protein
MQILGASATSQSNGLSSDIQDIMVKTEKIFIEDADQNDNYIKVKKLSKSRHSSAEKSSGSNKKDKNPKLKQSDLNVKHSQVKAQKYRKRSTNSKSSTESITNLNPKPEIKESLQIDSGSSSDDSLQKELKKLKMFKNEIKAKISTNQKKSVL